MIDNFYGVIDLIDHQQSLMVHSSWANSEITQIRMDV